MRSHTYDGKDIDCDSCTSARERCDASVDLVFIAKADKSSRLNQSSSLSKQDKSFAHQSKAIALLASPRTVLASLPLYALIWMASQSFELTDLLYASKVTMKDVADGVEDLVMHACGHDMHMICQLAAAEHLARIKPRRRLVSPK